jgi:hypothetical protein
MLVLLGIVLVHDITNRTSHTNLRGWIAQVLGTSSYSFKHVTNRLNSDPTSPLPSSSSTSSTTTTTTGGYWQMSSATIQIPVLVIGNKTDLASMSDSSRSQLPTFTSSAASDIPESFRMVHMHTCTHTHHMCDRSCTS